MRSDALGMEWAHGYQANVKGARLEAIRREAQLTLNQWVPGSSPGGCTKPKQSLRVIGKTSSIAGLGRGPSYSHATIRSNSAAPRARKLRSVCGSGLTGINMEGKKSCSRLI